MSFKITNKVSSFESFLDEVVKEIDFKEAERRLEAGKYTAKLMKKNVSSKGKSLQGGYPSKLTGRNQRLISARVDNKDRSVKVGSKDNKVHLLEFGHGRGKELNKRPFVYRTFKEAEPEIIKIMSREYF